MHQRGNTSDHSLGDGVIIGRARIAPHDFIKMHVGIYEDIIPTPEFTVRTEPNIGSRLQANLERSNDGDYTLEYFFKNISDQNCEVTVWAKDGFHGSIDPA